MTNPLVSVIIPTYNRPNLIGEALESVLAQTYSDIEVLIIDGSNNETTRKKISTYSDPRIRYQSVKNISAANSRNVGIGLSTGEFIAFNDDDDLWHKEKLAKQLPYFQDLECAAVYAICRKSLPGYNQLIPAPNTAKDTKGNLHQDLLKQNFIALPSLVLRSSCCREIRFDERLNCLEDWEWLIRISQKYHFDFCQERLVEIRHSPVSVNKSGHNIKAAAYEHIFRKHQGEIRNYPETEAKHLLSIGNQSFLSGNIKKGREYIRKSLKRSPKVTTALSLLLTYFGPCAYNRIFKAFEKRTGRGP